MIKKIPVRKKYKDFIPKDDAGLAIWSGNYKDNFRNVIEGDNIQNIRTDEIAEQESMSQELIDAVSEVFVQKSNLAKAVSHKDDLKAKYIPKIRNMAMRYKTSVGYDPAKAALLNILYTGQPIDYSVIVPEIKPKVRNGHVEISFHRHHVLYIAIYSRLSGDVEWEYLGIEIKSPFIDRRPLKNPPVPEKREYKAIYSFLGAHLVGKESSIVEVLFGG
jgi:hypothetical protein